MPNNTTLFLKLMTLNLFLWYNCYRCKEEDVMQVTQYIFQSPYSSAVQVGRLDTSSSQEQSSTTSNNPAVTTQTQEKVQAVAQVQKKPEAVKPTTPSGNSLDIFA